MSDADRIRAFLTRRYVQPARARGQREITIRAGDAHSEIGLQNRMPAVCSVLDGKLFRSDNGLELLDRSGPPQGATAAFRFRITDAQSTPDPAERHCASTERRLQTPLDAKRAGDNVSEAGSSGEKTSRFAAALAYATLIHGGQWRKGTKIPYISHLLSVSALVMEFGGDEDLAIAGLLHDALEDCGAWHEGVIRANWGGRVADIVCACTDGVPGAQGQKAPWRERKKKYLAHLESVDDAGVLLVSACDELHNARAIVADLKSGEDVFGRFKAGRDGTLWYYAELVRIFRKHLGDGSALVRQLEEAVNEVSA